MKKRFICFSLFSTSFFIGHAQPVINPYSVKRITQSTAELVYSQYLGNGDHSAITGGKGTEKLTVFEPEFILNHTIDSLHASSVDVGIDVITSASMDNIDTVVSSASRVSDRFYIRPGYQVVPKNNRNISFGANAYFSIESAYLSLGGALSVSAVSKDKSREFSAEIQAYFDDLRWGRLNGERPLKLVYPIELRDSMWFSNYKRNTYNLNTGISQAINEKMIIAFFPGLTYQYGLLSTPYHRVYFNDGSERVEKLPDKRWEFPLGLQLNSFILRRYILSIYYRLYHDDFDITSHTFSAELTAKISLRFSLTPSFRFYTQKGSPYFKPFGESGMDQAYYTSNYALSSFNSYETGLSARLLIDARQRSKIYFTDAELRYSYYKRTDGLHAHLLSLVLDLNMDKKENQTNLK